MKKYILSFFTAASLLAASNVALAYPYVAISSGYQLTNDNTKKHQEQAFGYSQEDHGLVQVAVGYSNVLPNVNIQLEYTNVLASGNPVSSTKQQNISLVGLVPITRLGGSVDLYGLAGAGYTYLEGDGITGKEEDALTIVGAGLEYILNPTVSLVSEVRTTYSINHNYWQPQVLAGAKINLNSVFNNALKR